MHELMEMDRRGLLARVLLLAGASAAASACQTVDALAPLEAGTAGGLNTAQMATLSAAAALIIPQTDTAGALEAGVPERLNGLIANWASPETRTLLETALDQIDALPGRGRHFAALPVAEQQSLLVAHDAAAMQPSDQVETVFISTRRLPVNPGYGRLKDLIVALYFMSREGLTQELVYEHVPGRWEPSIPVTAATRPWGDVSNF